jgi:hypothetical protein
MIHLDENFEIVPVMPIATVTEGVSGPLEFSQTLVP